MGFSLWEILILGIVFGAIFLGGISVVAVVFFVVSSSRRREHVQPNNDRPPSKLPPAR